MVDLNSVNQQRLHQSHAVTCLLRSSRRETMSEAASAVGAAPPRAPEWGGHYSKGPGWGTDRIGEPVLFSTTWYTLRLQARLFI